MGMSSNIYSAADSPDTSDLPSFIRMLDKFVDDDDWEGKVHKFFNQQDFMRHPSHPLQASLFN
jgi:hypothetical protein